RKASTRTITTASSNRFSKARRMPVRPAQMARTFMTLGMTIRSGICDSFGPRDESTRPLGSKGGKGVSIGSADPHHRLAAHAAIIGEHGFTSNCRLANSNTNSRIGWKININARSETDQAKPLAHRQIIILVGPADDTTGNQTSNLNNA